MILTIVFTLVVTGIAFVVIAYPLIIKGTRSLDEILLATKTSPDAKNREVDISDLAEESPVSEPSPVNEPEDEIEKQVLALRRNKQIACPRCGKRYAAGTKYCANCGAKLKVKK